MSMDLITLYLSDRLAGGDDCFSWLGLVHEVVLLDPDGVLPQNRAYKFHGNTVFQTQSMSLPSPGGQAHCSIPVTE